KMEAAPRESLRLTCTAQMNYRGELLLVLWADRRVWPLRENRDHIAVQIYRRELDRAAREDAGVEPRERAAVLNDDMVAAAIGKGCVGHLIHANAARGRLVDRKGVPA